MLPVQTVGGDGMEGERYMAGIDDRSVSIGRIFGRAFGVMSDNPLVVFGVALVLGAGPQVLYALMVGTNTAALGASSATAAIGEGLLVFLVSIIARLLVSGCITRATVAYSQGRRASLADCLGVALRRFLSLIGVTLLQGLGIVLGMILLIVPVLSSQ